MAVVTEDFGGRNLANNSEGRGPNNFLTIQGNGNDVIRITGRNMSGYSVPSITIDKHYENIIGYN